MLILLSDEHKAHLSFLGDINVSAVKEFCKIAVGFIREGANTQIFKSAAHKLDVSIDMIQNTINGLIFLLTESSKLLVSDIDYLDSIMVLGFSDDLNNLLLTVYVESRVEIRSILGEMSMRLPHFHDMQWRLDVQLHSRHLRHTAIPKALIKLNINKECGNVESQLLEADPVNVLHVTQILETALKEASTAHSRRVIRNIR